MSFSNYNFAAGASDPGGLDERSTKYTENALERKAGELRRDASGSRASRKYGERFKPDSGYVDVDTRVSRESHMAARMAAGAVIAAVSLLYVSGSTTGTLRLPLKCYVTLPREAFCVSFGSETVVLSRWTSQNVYGCARIIHRSSFTYAPLTLLTYAKIDKPEENRKIKKTSSSRSGAWGQTCFTYDRGRAHRDRSFGQQ